MNEHALMTLPGGRKLSYAVYGDESGRPLFYFHGWPSSRLQGRLLHQAALAKGIRVIAPDRPGLGASDPLPGRTFSQWSADVAALADYLHHECFAVLGVSGGAPYSLAVSTALPGRVVATAVCCGAPPLSRPSDHAELHPVYRVLIRLHGLRRAALPSLIRLSKWMIARGPDKLPMSLLLKTIPASDRAALDESGGWDAITGSYLEATSQGAGPIHEEGELYVSPWDFSPEDVRSPIHFWHGEADRNIPCELAKQLAARIPHAQAYWVPGEGHYSLPIRYQNQILAWLEQEMEKCGLCC